MARSIGGSFWGVNRYFTDIASKNRIWSCVAGDGHAGVNGTDGYSNAPLFFSRSAIASASLRYPAALGWI